MTARLLSLTVLLFAVVILGEPSASGQESSSNAAPRTRDETPSENARAADGAEGSAEFAAPQDAGSPDPGARNSRPRPRRQAQTNARARRLLAQRRQSRYRLTRMPAMFGDSLVSGEFLSGGDFARFPIWDRHKIADNGHVVPQDRQYVDFRHYSDSAELVGGARRSADTNRYRLAAERIVDVDGDWSVEVRLPFTSQGGFGAATSVDTDGIGDLSVITKRRIRSTETSVVSAGLGVTVPTGEDIRFGTALGTVELDSDAFHLQPFIGCLSAPFDDCFMQSFIQLDVPTNGNSVRGGGVNAGRLNEKTKLYLDAQAGRWLFRQAGPVDGLCLTGLAAILELHYTHDLSNDNDMAVVPGIGTVATIFNRQDVLNLTTGFHGELGPDTDVRFAVGVPVTNKLDRDFNVEFIFTLVRRI